MKAVHFIDIVRYVNAHAASRTHDVLLAACAVIVNSTSKLPHACPWSGLQ